MLGRTDSRIRLIALLVVFVVASLALVSRLAFWQIVERDWLLERAVAQTTVRLETPSRRGSIYDRSGTVALASTVDRDRLAAAPNQMTAEEREQTATALVGMLGLDEEAAATLRGNLATDRAYVVIARDVLPSTSERIRAALADGRIAHVSLEPEPVRVYPQEGGGPDSTLAAHLLGFVNREGVGQYGVEQFYQSTLSGSPRVAIAQRDITGRVLQDTAHVDDSRAARNRPAPHHRRRPAGDARAGAAGRVDRGQGQERLGGRARPVHRRDLRHGDVPLVRRERLSRDRRHRTIALRRPRRLRASTSRARCSR